MEQTLAIWHEIIASGDTSRLADILAEDCTFISPVVHTPQCGRDLTQLYLTGAAQILANGTFRYVKEVVTSPNAVLEFQCEVDGIEVNGVDIISFDEEGKICEFKVMLRPLKAVNLVHAKMRAMLEQLAGAAGDSQ